MPNKFTNLVPNDSSASPSKSAFSGAVDGTSYGLNEWATVSKIKNTLIIILLVLYAAHISRLLHLTGSLLLIKTTHQNPQVKAPLMLQLMSLQMWKMSELQLVKYKIF